MTKQIHIRNSIHERLLSMKEEGMSFSDVLDKVLNREQAVMSTEELFMKEVVELKERVGKLEDFILKHSGGQFG